MRPSRRPQRTTGWLDGYTHQPSVEAVCEALEQRLNDGRRPWADAPRVPLFDTEQEWWAL